MELKKIFKKKTKVIIDTNFLMLPGGQGIDIFTEIPRLINDSIQMCVVESTLWELQRIIDGTAKSRTKKNKIKGSDKFNAKLGFILAKQKDLKVLKNSNITNYADEAILEFVNKNVIVATLDKQLQKKVLAKEGKIILVRQGKKLELQE